MYKRASTLIVISFSMLLALGLGTDLFLYQKLQQQVEDTAAETLFLKQTRVLVRDAQVDYMMTAQQVTDRLFRPAPMDAFSEKKWHEQKPFKNATEHIAAALAATRNMELKETLGKLIEHSRQVILPLGDEILWLATTDLDAAKNIYWSKYLPAQAENTALFTAAIRLSSDELSSFNEKANEATAQALFLSRLAMLLFACLGIGTAIFLAQAVTRLIRLTEKAAKENQDLMDNSLDVICSVDETGRFIRVSRACERNWGYTPQELVGRAYSELIHPDDVDKTLQVAMIIMTGNSIRNFDNRYIHKDGSVIHNNWSAQ